MKVIIIIILILSITPPETKSADSLSNTTFLHWTEIQAKQDDPRFVEFVRRNYLHAWRGKAYNLRLKNPITMRNPQTVEQVPTFAPFFKHIKNGFFVEAGAHDGEYLSNTLWLEKVHGWKGLLIEADPKNFAKLNRTGRRAILSPVCLSTSMYPEIRTFYRNGNTKFYPGTHSSLIAPERIKEAFRVHCIPFYTVLAAAGRKRVDFLSLDIEGSELDVLKTIPFDEIEFMLLTIEYTHIIIDGTINAQRNRKVLKSFMKKNGYIFYAERTEYCLCIPR